MKYNLCLPRRGESELVGNSANIVQGMFELRGKRKGDTIVEW